MTPKVSIPRRLERLYRQTVEAISGRHAVARYLRQQPHTDEPYCLVAIGKAAASMCRGAHDVLGQRIQHGLVITAADYLDENLPENMQLALGEHPVPGRGSLAAGQQLLRFLKQVGPDGHCLFLLSGGASSLVEVAADGIDADLLGKANHWLLGSGLDIQRMNAVRQGLSQIKNGGLRHFLPRQPLTALYISDVPGDDLHSLGSGLLYGDGQSRWQGLDLPSWLTTALRKAEPRHPAPPPCRGCHVIVASLALARQQAAQSWQEGDAVFVHEEFLQGDVLQLAHRITSYLQSAAPGLHVWGGESTVRLPARCGRGGRNLHLALSAVSALADLPGVTLMAAATDGKDGNSSTAGAIVDNTTYGRGLALGLRPPPFLARADAQSYLEQTAILIPQQATGTNVMDLLIAHKA